MSHLQFVYVGLPIVAIATLVALGYLAWQRRPVPGATVFVVLCCSLIVWTVGGTLSVANADLVTVVFWSKFKYFGVVTMPPLWLAFTLQYTERDHYLTRRTFALLAIHPIVTLLLLWTTELHKLFWISYHLNYIGSFPIFYTEYGIAFWLHSGYSYALTLIGTTLLLRRAWVSLRIYKLQLFILVVTSLVPLVANVLSVVGLVPLPGLDITPITFAIAGAGALWALLGYDMLNLMPIARDAVLENLLDGVMVVDSQNRIVDLNPAARQMIASFVSNPIGKTLEVVFSTFPELLKHYLTTSQAEAELEVPVNGQNRYFDLRISPLVNHRGVTQGRLVVWRDITERKRNEEALSKSINQFALLRRVDGDLGRKLDLQYVLAISLDFALRSTDADTGFIGIMEGDMLRVAHLFGNYPDVTVGAYLPPDRGIVGRVIRRQQAELIADVRADPDFSPGIESTRAQICMPLISQERCVGILNLETSKVNHFTPEMFDFLKIVTSRIASALDNARLYQISLTQLTELQALYAKVSHLERLKTDMINMAAHDLRNPLNIITSYVFILREELNGELTDHHKSFLNSIDQASNRILKITGDILSLERIEQSASALESVDMTRLTQEVFDAHYDQAKLKSLQFELTLPTNTTLTVNGDQAQLQEAMSNLISNAIKYTPPEGRVNVQLAQVTFKVVFEVRDSGYGIPTDQQNSIFRPFFRASTEETQNIEGSGLGLHLVHNIVERHHGKMIFHSVYGQGSTFGFEITSNKRSTGNVEAAMQTDTGND